MLSGGGLGVYWEGAQGDVFWNHHRLVQLDRVLWFFFLFFFWFFFFFGLFRAAPVAYECSQARDRIRAVAAGLCHSHSIRSELCLRPTPELTSTLDL